MRHARTGLVSRLLLLLLLAAGTAHAQRGIDSETFRPALDGFGMVAIERAETAKQWDFGFQILSDYAHKPLRLALHAEGQAATGRAPAMDFQVATHLGMWLGLTNWMELALEVPVSAQRYSALYGKPLDDSTVASGRVGPTGFYAAEPRTNVGPPNAGMMDPRIALKLRTPRLGPVGFGLVLAGTVPFGDDSAFLGDRGFTFRPSGIIDLTLGRFTAAVNIGGIVRRTTRIYDPLPAAGADPSLLIQVGSELSGGLGLGVRATSWLGFTAEAYGLWPLTKSVDGSTPDRVLDVIGSARFYPGRGITITAGGGGGVIDARRRDTFRAFLGIAWAPSGKGSVGSRGDRDGDGIPDGQDLCPDAAEDKDGFHDEDGCPDPDNDGDGILDGADQCPNETEDLDGFQDEDGCPDLDNDGDGIPDTADQCPNEPEDKDGFQDEDGCPDADNDGDGIPDATDKCPNEPETPNGVADQDGCPDTGHAGGTATEVKP